MRKISKATPYLELCISHISFNPVIFPQVLCANGLICLSISAANKTLNLDFLIQESEQASGKSHGKFLTLNVQYHVIYSVTRMIFHASVTKCLDFVSQTQQINCCP